MRKIVALAMALALFWSCAGLGESVYVENEWVFVDGAIDATHGIPEDAEGALLRIRESGLLRVATEPYYPPQEFIDPALTGQEQYVGADMQMARLIAQRMGVALEIVPMEFSEVLDAVSDGLCDLAISGLAYTPERASRVTLSKGYHYSTDPILSGILIREADRDTITDVEALRSRDIVAQSGSLQEALMAEHVPHYREFRRVSSMQEVYDAVQSGAEDAAAVNQETAQAYIDNNPGCGLTLIEGVGFDMEPQFDGDRVAAKKDELQLVYFVNGVIDELLASGEYESWYREAEAYAARLGL